MKEKIKVAVIGVGHLGKFHAQKLCELPYVELVALVDPQEDRLEEAQRLLFEKYQVKPKLYRDYREVIPEIRAAIVSSPSYTHYEIGKKLLQEGKALFLEKPIADDYGKAKELVSLAEERNLPLQIGYIERFQQAVKRLLQKTEKPLFIEAHRLSSFVERNLDIDVILDLMIHDLDLVMLLKKGVEIEEFHAVGAPLFTDKPDIVNARIIFADGTTCNLTASRVSLSKQRKFRVFEKGVYYSVDTIEKSFLEIRPKPAERDFVIEREVFPEDDPLKAELEAFFEAILSNRTPSPSGREALLPLKVAFRIKEEVMKNLQRFLRE